MSRSSHRFVRRVVLALVTLAAGAAVPTRAATTQVIEDRYTNAAGPFVFGTGSGGDILVITNRGWLESTVGIIGNAAATPSNSVVVTGVDSLWENTQSLFVGLASPWNRLELSAQARVFGPFTVLGSQASSSNNSIVANAARLYAGSVFIGEAGSGNTVLLENGAALVSGGQGSVGYSSPSSNNLVRVTDPGSIWFHSGLISVGSYGSSGNSVFVSRGGIVQTSRSAIGSGNNNRVVISDPATFWINDYGFTVGAGASGNSLTVSNGARVISGGALVSGNSNTVVLAGNNTSWDTGDRSFQLIHGEGGTSNALFVREGASLLTWNSYLTGNANYFELRGSGTRWTNREVILLGFETDLGNQLAVLEGARVDSDSTSLSGDGGILLVDGAGSLLSNATLLTVGNEYGTGNLLDIRNGGQVRSQGGLLGGFDTPYASYRNHNNKVRIRGAGSRWEVNGSLEVGVTSFDNEMRVEGGARLVATKLSLATYGYSGNNSLLLTDTNSVCEVTQDLVVGAGGSDNALSVLAGAKLFTGNARLGPQSSRNKALVSGPGSAWTNAVDLTIGSGGSGQSLTISNGAKVKTYMASIGPTSLFFVPTRSNRVEVTGPGSELAVTEFLQLGAASPVNTLLVANGGSVRAGNVQIGFSGVSFENRLVVTNGQLTVTNSDRTASLYVRRGTLLIDGGDVVLDTLRAGDDPDSEVLLRSGNLTINAATIGSAPPFQVGAGAAPAHLTLRAGQHTFASGINVAAGSTLHAAGVLSGGLTNGGALSAGVPIADLRLPGGLNLRDSSTLVVDVGGRVPGAGYDTINASNQTRLGGVLKIVLAAGFVPAQSDTLVILQFGSRTGSFSNAPSGSRVPAEGGMGSFLVTYTPTSIRLSGFQPPGTGGADVPDDWAFQYFGHAPLTEEELHADADLDGLSNYEEYLAGTNPVDASSVLKVRSVAIDALGRAVVRFSCVTEKNYSIEYSDDLESWENVLQPQFNFPEPGVCEWIDAGLANAHSRRAYRVVVW